MTTTGETDTGTMGRVYALLVAIDEYLPPVPALFGCANDARHLANYLTGRVGDRLSLVTLTDREATRQAVIDTFRAHLGQAGAGDVALFAYSGHGSEEPAPAEFETREASGRIQTLVCWDSGRRVAGTLVRGLADKELSVLISEVAARGAHVAVVLDCCHSGNGTRDASVRVRQWVADPARVDAAYRADVTALAAGRPTDGFLAGSGRTARLDHVALSACQSFELAKEVTIDGEARGVFSIALLDALRSVGPSTSYRSLLAAVRTRVERSTGEQRPALFPTDAGGPADATVLDGAVQPGAVAFHVTKGIGGWEVDGGAIHGFVAGAGEDSFELACTRPGESAIAGMVRVEDVGPARSTVAPIGWQPDDIAYDAVIADVPLPVAALCFEPSDDPLAAGVYDQLVAALGTAGAGGGPSPYVRIADGGPGATGGALRVAVHPSGYSVVGVDGTVVTHVRRPCIRVLRADGTAATSDVPADGPGGFAEAIPIVVARLEHVARWEQLLALGGHPSRLRDAVRLEVVAAEAGEVAAPQDRPALAPAPGYELAYQWSGSDWVAPAMFLRLVNSSAHDLYVAVLDLTDRFRCHAALFPTTRVAAGHTVVVWDGAPIDASLPEGRDVTPGASARDWLKVIVSEVDFDATAFEMPALDEPLVVTRGATEGSTLERLAARVITRDIGARPPAGVERPDWCATTYEVTIRVPESMGGGSGRQ